MAVRPLLASTPPRLPTATPTRVIPYAAVMNGSIRSSALRDCPITKRGLPEAGVFVAVHVAASYRRPHSRECAFNHAGSSLQGDDRGGLSCHCRTSTLKDSSFVVHTGRYSSKRGLPSRFRESWDGKGFKSVSPRQSNDMKQAARMAVPTAASKETGLKDTGSEESSFFLHG